MRDLEFSLESEVELARRPKGAQENTTGPSSLFINGGTEKKDVTSSFISSCNESKREIGLDERTECTVAPEGHRSPEKKSCFQKDAGVSEEEGEKESSSDLLSPQRVRKEGAKYESTKHSAKPPLSGKKNTGRKKDTPKEVAASRRGTVALQKTIPLTRKGKKEEEKRSSDEYWHKKVQQIIQEKKKGLERLSKKHAECMQLMKGNQILTTLVLEQADIIDSLKLKLQRAQTLAMGGRKSVELSSALKRRHS